MKGPYADMHGNVRCVVSGFAIFGPTIKPGAYAIDFTGTNGTWRELLSITELDAEIREEVTVTRPEGGAALVHRIFRAPR